jgi:L-2-hydroxyglutarate oxidase
LEALAERAGGNGLRVRRIGRAELRALEPEVSGVAALLVPATGIVDFRRVTTAMADDVYEAGGHVELGVRVDHIEERSEVVVVRAGEREWRTRHLVVCAGLQADRMARLAGVRSDFRIVPFRGEYYRLPDSRSQMVRHLIYPVPDPDLPFLGVHLTRMIDGSVTVGPNAVLGMAREGYPKWSFDARDVQDWLTFPGMWAVARTNVRTGAEELRDSLLKRGYLSRCRKYAPGLTLKDLQPYEAGIRAQAVMDDGTLVHDFLLETTERSVHVCNAPSPAATSALPIADEIVDRVLALDTARIGG